MKRKNSLYFFLITLIIGSCSGVKKEILVEDKININLENCNEKVYSLDDVTNNFKCISMAVSIVDSQLAQGDSANALKVSHKYFNIYPFDSRLKMSFEKSLSVFITTTEEMLAESEPECDIVLSRMSLLKNISPDTKLITTKCNIDLLQGRKLDRELSLSELSNAKTLQFDKRNFDDLRSQILYKYAKDIEDNYDELILAGLKFWQGLSIQSRDIKIGGKEGKNVFVKFKGRLSLVEYNSCVDFKKFAVENGSEVICRKIMGNTLTVDRISMGAKNSGILGKFIHSIPQMLIFSLSLKSRLGVKKYFYAVDNVRLTFGDNISDTYKLSFKDSVIAKFDANQPVLSLPEWISNGVSTYYEKHYGGPEFGLYVNLDDLSGVTDISIDFEGYKTYKAYTMNRDPVHDWKKAIEN